MSVRIEYSGDKPSDSQIVRILNAQYPNKIFSLGPGDTIVESYRDQPPISTRGERIEQAELLRKMREAQVGYSAVEASIGG